MRRVVEYAIVYSVMGAVIWWLWYVRADHRIVTLVAGLATAVLTLMVIREIAFAWNAAVERRDAESGRAAVAEAERLRQRTFDLCAGLRLGFDICENCWTSHPDKAARELDRLRAAVGQFIATELGNPVSN